MFRKGPWRSLLALSLLLIQPDKLRHGSLRIGSAAAASPGSVRGLGGYSPTRARIVKEVNDAQKAGILGQPPRSLAPSAPAPTSSEGKDEGQIKSDDDTASSTSAAPSVTASRERRREDNEIRLFVNPANMLEWHYTIAGPAGTPFEGGLYHGRIMLPGSYPNAPPSLVMFTPNGRFMPNKRICLSASEFHPESWTPGWTIQMLTRALIPHMHTEVAAEIGSVSTTPTEKRYRAARSRTYKCKAAWCRCDHSQFPEHRWPKPKLPANDKEFEFLRTKIASRINSGKGSQGKGSSNDRSNGNGGGGSSDGGAMKSRRAPGRGSSEGMVMHELFQLITFKQIGMVLVAVLAIVMLNVALPKT